MFLKLLLISVFSAFVSAEKVRLDNFSLYRINPQSEEQLEFLNDLYKKSDKLDFWRMPTSISEFVSVVVSPDIKNEFDESLSQRGIPYEVTVKDIQKAFDDQVSGKQDSPSRTQMFWTNYQTIDEIYEWFYHLAATHRSIVTVITVGQSFEGRNITGIKLSRGTATRSFFLEAGQVAADWLSPTVLTYVVDQLIRGTTAEARAALEEYDWHIFPILNPDGHVFTQDSLRLWVKNRGTNFRSTFLGVDLTKNWNAQWGVSGGSFEARDNNFIGLGPFSEQETRAVARYVESLNLVGFLSFRGFGQRLIIPFAHADIPMYNFNDMLIIGRRAMGSLAVRYGTQYLVGGSRQVFVPQHYRSCPDLMMGPGRDQWNSITDGATGNSADWAKHRFNPPIAATYQLRDTGFWGYTLPVAQVLPSCEETFDSIMAIIREAKFINVL